jgi:hypothetical protein
MIAKEIASPRTGGSFRDLVAYLTNNRGKEERVGSVRLSNCVSADAESAVLEVENTQARNQRARHTTYHLMLAFPAGEEPPPSALEEIERRACEALGFANHQRVSVVHHDTDHLHVHVAINRVHPRTARVNCPSFSKLVLDRVCVELETEYGLQPVRHRARDRQTALVAPEGAGVPARRSPDTERVSGFESLIGFVQRECADDLCAARSWAEIHEVAAAHGLRARLRGNGLVFVAANGTAVKASSVSRELSKGALEGRLGSFEAAVAATTVTQTQYGKLPLLKGAAALLYEQYRRECGTIGSGPRPRIAQPDAEQSCDRERVRVHSQRRWAAIRLLAKGRVAWMLWSAYARHADRRERDRLRQRSRARRRAVAPQKPRPRWLDWLRGRAARGDEDALSALRARGIPRARTARSVWGDARAQWVPPMRPDSATATGTLIYRVPGGSIRDDGSRLHLTQSASSNAAAEALVRLAYARFGARIGVDGDETFRVQLARAAAAASLPVTFVEARVERRSSDMQQKEDPHAVVRPERGRSR